jgi:hypothetical protein
MSEPTRPKLQREVATDRVYEALYEAVKLLYQCYEDSYGLPTQYGDNYRQLLQDASDLRDVVCQYMGSRMLDKSE